MTAILMIAKNTFVEALRRRDIYVLAVISFLLITVACFVSFWGASGLQRFLTDVSMTVIGWCSLIIAVVITARQLPTEIEARSLYPLLAKPISRTGYLVGKFLGCWGISVCSMLVFTLAYLFALFVFVKGSAGLILIQALVARTLMLSIVVSLTLWISTFLTHSANVTVMLLFCFGARLASNAIMLLYEKVGPVASMIMKTAYFIIPHIELFDMSKKVVHLWPPMPWLTLAQLAVYAGIYVVLFLGLASCIFSRKPL